MKFNKTYLSTILLVLIVANGYVNAQNNDDAQQELNYLTLEQKEILKEQQLLLDETRAIFKENLSEEQLTLLSNQKISKDQRTRLLKESLTKSQRNIIVAKKQLIRVKRDRFRRSLTKKQRIRLRRFLQRRNISDRRRLVRRLRRLIQNNMD